MRRKILIVESADTMRAVAETILRQNGYEVMAVATADQAAEVMELTRPDLVVVAADMRGADEKLYYEKLQEDPRTATVPFLLFEPLDKSSLDFPAEAVIPRPFEPRDFVNRVNVFAGQGEAAPKPAANPPLNGSAVDDDFLDAALGLNESSDGLQVTDSEVMGQTTGVTVRSQAKSEENMIGMNEEAEPTAELSDSKRVESLVIEDEVSQISHRPPKPKPKPLEGSGKLEILNDQYGLTEPEDTTEDNPDQVHDYDWFINSIAQDAKPGQSQPEGPIDASDAGDLTFSDPSAAVDPVTPGPASVGAVSDSTKKAAGSGVEKFIDEFKKEIEQLRSTEHDDIAGSSSAAPTAKPKDGLTWEETLEKVGPEEVNQFAGEFARELGRAVAEKIVAKIDSDKLLALIRAELFERRRKKS
ncbi:MAG: hypothetical protein GY867_05875 [bacterium]|nr:hypothetical protein [bacterium]